MAFLCEKNYFEFDRKNFNRNQTQKSDRTARLSMALWKIFINL
jgi:hypothetical protein